MILLCFPGAPYLVVKKRTFKNSANEHILKK